MGMGYNPIEHGKDIGKNVTSGLKEGTKDPVAFGKKPVENVIKDVSTAASTAGGSISNAAKVTGSDISNAYHTSVVDPLKDLGAKAQEMAKKWGGKAEDWIKKLQSGSGIENIQQITGPQMPTGGAGIEALTAKMDPTKIQTLSPDMQKLMANERFAQGQQTLAQQLAQQAAGRGPSVAGEQFKQAQQANVAAQMAALASQRGGANPAAARQTMQSAQQVQAQTAREAALARIQEQMGAREQLAGVLGTARGQDLERAGQGQGLAIQQAQLSQGDKQLQQQQAQLAAEIQAKYAGMDLSAQQANQLASIEMAKIAAGQPSPLAVGANILSSLFAYGSQQ